MKATTLQDPGSRRTCRSVGGVGARTGSQGFTVIELMIVVVVIAILSSVAIPSYQEQMRKTHRSAAKQWLVDIANAQAQYLMDARSYGNLADVRRDTPPARVGDYYTVAVAQDMQCGDPNTSSAPSPGFCLSAIPKTGTLLSGDPTLKLDHRGVRLPADQWD